MRTVRILLVPGSTGAREFSWILGIRAPRRHLRIKARLTKLGHVVLDPWEQLFHCTIEEAGSVTDWLARAETFRRVARQIGAANESMIRECDVVFGVLDGVEIDSGVASEIGYAAGIGKRCYGLRTDFRDCGDFDGISINLQVLFWIERSGGMLFRRIEEIRFDEISLP